MRFGRAEGVRTAYSSNLPADSGRRYHTPLAPDSPNLRLIILRLPDFFFLMHLNYASAQDKRSTLTLSCRYQHRGHDV